MKKIFTVLPAAALLLASCGNTNTKNAPIVLTSLTDSMSYAIGSSVAQQMRQGFEDVNVDALAKGLRDAMDTSVTPVFSEEEGRNVMGRFQTMKMDEVRAEQEVYLEENKALEGVVVTESGLQYRIIKEGDGAIAKPGETVEVNYEGKLIDGTVFDSSYGRGETFKFNTAGGVIPAWIEISQLLPMGTTVEIVAPYNLAYGERGNRGIPPFATLIFKIDLIDIVPAEAKPVM